MLYVQGGDRFRTEEIDLLAKQEKVIIFFDNYATAQGAIGHLAARIPKAKFIVEVRSAIFEVRYHEVADALPGPFVRMDLNGLLHDEIESFTRLGRSAGLEIEHKSSETYWGLRDVLIKMLSSPHIRSKMKDELGPIFLTKTARKVLLIAYLLKSFHMPNDSAFIKAVTGEDPFEVFSKNTTIAKEVFDTGIDDFGARSSIFSDFALKVFLSSDEKIQGIVDATVVAASLRDERNYRIIMSNMMRYTNIRDLFSEQVRPSQYAVKIYEKLRVDAKVEAEPLFWLQYAIAMIDEGDNGVAETFIDNAYTKSKNFIGFETYQIDTQAFRIKLMIETLGSGPTISRMPEIIRLTGKIGAMLLETSHRNYAIRVLEQLPQFLTARHESITAEDKVYFATRLDALSSTLGALPASYRAQTGSDKIKSSIDHWALILS